MIKRPKWPWLAGFVLLTVAVIIGLALIYRQRIPPGMVRDIRAGLPARRISDPEERLKTYLENRYGPLSDPANRQKVFLDFFESDRIQALQLIVKHSPKQQQQANVDAMARWVEGYRQTMSDNEKAALAEKFHSPQGRAKLRNATALYNSQDVRYRGMTAPVISELLKTISAVQAE